MIRPKGLGRGLDALLSGSADAAPPSSESLQMLAIERLRPGKYQPRTRMDAASLAELADSIREQGMMQPILVRPVDGGRYEIVAGERRWRAAQQAGLREVPALVKAIPDQSALALSLIENIQREDLNPLEEAQGLQRLCDEFGLTHDAVAKAIGRSRSTVTNLLRLNTLAKPVQDYLYQGALEMGHARAPRPDGGAAGRRRGARGGRRPVRPRHRAARASAAEPAGPDGAQGRAQRLRRRHGASRERPRGAPRRAGAHRAGPQGRGPHRDPLLHPRRARRHSGPRRRGRRVNEG